VFVCCGVRIHTQSGVCGPVCVTTYCGIRFTSGGQMQMACVCARACVWCVCVWRMSTITKNANIRVCAVYH